MNSEILRQKLLASARLETPSEEVPYAFEQRIMNQLRAGYLPDVWTTCGSLFWRALAPCCAVMIAVGISSLPMQTPPLALDLGEQIEAVLLAGLDPGVDLP